MKKQRLSSEKETKRAFSEFDQMRHASLDNYISQPLISLTTLAGIPAIIWLSPSIARLTTELPATTQLFPILVFLRIVVLAAIQTLLPI